MPDFHIYAAPHTGIGVYLLSGHKVLPENAVILATSSQQIPDITCLSGSTTDSVGQLIGVQGQDVTHRHGDPFSVVLGSGMVRMQHSRSYFTDEGIYSCRLTDETGNNVDVNFGLYLEQFNGKCVSIYNCIACNFKY